MERPATSSARTLGRRRRCHDIWRTYMTANMRRYASRTCNECKIPLARACPRLKGGTVRGVPNNFVCRVEAGADGDLVWSSASCTFSPVEHEGSMLCGIVSEPLEECSGLSSVAEPSRRTDVANDLQRIYAELQATVPIRPEVPSRWRHQLWLQKRKAARTQKKGWFPY